MARLLGIKHTTAQRHVRIALQHDGCHFARAMLDVSLICLDKVSAADVTVDTISPPHAKAPKRDPSMASASMEPRPSSTPHGKDGASQALLHVPSARSASVRATLWSGLLGSTVVCDLWVLYLMMVMMYSGSSVPWWTVLVIPPLTCAASPILLVAGLLMETRNSLLVGMYTTLAATLCTGPYLLLVAATDGQDIVGEGMTVLFALGWIAIKVAEVCEAMALLYAFHRRQMVVDVQRADRTAAYQLSISQSKLSLLSNGEDGVVGGHRHTHSIPPARTSFISAASPSLSFHQHQHMSVNNAYDTGRESPDMGADGHFGDHYMSSDYDYSGFDPSAHSFEDTSPFGRRHGEGLRMGRPHATSLHSDPTLELSNSTFFQAGAD